jgi:3-hydroxybutyryl-CoA dehydrogenase
MSGTTASEASVANGTDVSAWSSLRIGTVGVVGSGTMGRGIAESCLRAGLKVVLHDASGPALAGARSHIGAALQLSVDKGHAPGEQAEGWLAALETAADISGLSGCDLAIEAVPEVPEIKLDVLARMAACLPEEAVMASNTSSIPITRLAAAVRDNSRFLGLHFFNPVPRMALVEVIPTVLTSDATTRTVELFVEEQLHKTALTVPDRPGFAVNALLIPYLLSAARMLDAGYAAAESIDRGMKLGCGHPIGPLQLCDFIGLDVVCHVADAVYAETKDPACIVPNNLRRLVEAGRLGRKTGHGFYSHPAKPA